MEQKKYNKILPYKLFKISGREGWYYQFKIQMDDGKAHWTNRRLLPNSRGIAQREAMDILINLYASGEKNKLCNFETIKKMDMDRETAENVCDWFKREGLIADFQTLSDTNKIPFVEFIRQIYSVDSERTLDLTRKGKAIGRRRLKLVRIYTNVYYDPYFKNKPLALVTKKEFKNFSISLQEKNISNATKNSILKVGKAVLHYAYQQGIIKDDVSAGDYLYADDTKETKILSFEQAKIFFSVGNELPIKHFYINALACCCGLRPAEIQALKIDDLGESEILLTHSWDGKGLKCPKNGKSRRIIFSDGIKWILEGMRRIGKASFSGFIFESDIKRNQPISLGTIQSTFRKQLQRFMTENESKEFHFYQWRHFHDTYLIGNGLDAQTLTRQSGHNVDMIMNLYSNHDTKEADEKLKLVQDKTFSGLFDVAKIE